MPMPHGRDRVRETEEGEVVLSSFRSKGWSGRPGGESSAAAGTAVDWDGAVYEVVRVEEPPSGGVRYTLRPWEEGRVIRQIERYGPDTAASSSPASGPEAGARSAPFALPPGAARLRERWLGVPSPFRVLLLGFVPGVLLSSFCLFHLMGEGMSFFVHELGHTAVALLFGRLAVPAVVMTITFDQSRLAAATIWVLLAGLAWRFRSVRGWRAAVAAAVVLYPVVAFTELHLDAIHVAGHLAELAVAALFFHRAVTGGLFSEWERPVYAFFAWYLWLVSSSGSRSTPRPGPTTSPSRSPARTTS